MALVSRVPMTPEPIREKRPRSSKIIFFSCEGVITEEEYFKILSNKIFADISSQLCLVSARKDFLKIPNEERTQEQWNEQNKSSPQYVLDRLENFKKDNDHIYEFKKHKDDEFWIVIDIDDHTMPNKISEFKAVIQECEKKNIKYAITNPFFEFWLYLHHFDVADEDKIHANKTGDNYFRLKMNSIGVTLGGNGHKVPNSKDYTIKNVVKAVERAKKLHTNKSERWPQELGSQVYLLVDEFFELLEENFIDINKNELK